MTITSNTTQPTNPVIAPRTLPYGLPDWNAIKPEHLLPALNEAIERQCAAWERIGSNPEPATIDNTVRALDMANIELTRVADVLYTLARSLGNSELDAIEMEANATFTSHFAAFYQNSAIYERLVSLEGSEELSRDPEATEIVRAWLIAFRQGGVALDAEGQATIRDLSEQLSRAETEFDQRAVKAMADNALSFKSAKQLAGLSASAIEAAKNDDGTYTLELDNVTNQPILAQLTTPSTRQKVLEASMSRGWGSHETSDTRELVATIARLRAQRAELLGYPHHAQMVAEREMAGNAETILDVLTRVATPALAAAKAQAKDLIAAAYTDFENSFTTCDLAPNRDRKTQAADFLAHNPDTTIFCASDWMYYQEKLRGELGVDDTALTPYFELNNVVERGIFYAAHELYGLSFKPRPDLAGYLPSVRTWEVFNEDGEGIALFQADYFRRTGKHGGAWMNTVGAGDEITGKLPAIMNNLNLAQPREGEPVLLTWDNVITVFHEFGHALHGMLTNTRYAATAGTNVPRDFVETPSQLNEMWTYNPQVLANYAVHHETGEPLPQELIAKLIQAKNFSQPFETTEFQAAALVDQEWHRHRASELPTTAEEVEEFERAALAKYGMDYELIPPRYRSTYFSHTFGGGYDAGYYSYSWAEILAADIEYWFTHDRDVNGDGGLNREAGRVLVDELLSRGSSRPPMESFRATVGRSPRPEAILWRRGLE